MIHSSPHLDSEGCFLRKPRASRHTLQTCRLHRRIFACKRVARDHLGRVRHRRADTCDGVRRAKYPVGQIAGVGALEHDFRVVARAVDAVKTKLLARVALRHDARCQRDAPVADARVGRPSSVQAAWLHGRVENLQAGLPAKRGRGGHRGAAACHLVEHVEDPVRLVPRVGADVRDRLVLVLAAHAVPDEQAACVALRDDVTRGKKDPIAEAGHRLRRMQNRRGAWARDGNGRDRDRRDRDGRERRGW
ncbi:hypothetical protein T492DRAFT_950151 [Pavlovales sp. CCMP2436]|nr:hypothetical protein T492DRAFT_950151 [Pavlovales sp. CCMP2436]